MQITLYKNNSDNKALNKNITNAKNINCEIKDTNSILNPTIFINKFAGFAAYNYCYIADFGRYYYITGVSVDLGNKIILNLKVDVLMTYKNQILNSNALILRQTNNPNKLLSDNVLQTQADEQIQNFKFSDGEFLSSVQRANYSFIVAAYSENTEL